MEKYTGKTIEEALEKASEDLNTPVSQLIYVASDKTTGLFSKKVSIEVYDFSDVIKYTEDYILNLTDALGIESSVKTSLDDDMIRITIDSTHNPLLIGKNGKSLQALNEVVRLVVSNHFHKRFRIFLDINGYKNHRYHNLERLARKIAHDVQKTKTTYTFDPMPSDERRAIHNAVSNMPNIKSESKGEGKARQVQIIYVD